METVLDLYFLGAPKLLQMVTAAMKLKDACSLEGNLWPTSIAYQKAETLPTKVRLGKAMVFPVVMYGCESWTVRNAEHQSIGVSASTSVLPMNTQDSSPLERTGWISLQSKGLSRVFSNTTVQKHKFFSAQLSIFIFQLSHPYMTIGKTIILSRQTFVGKLTFVSAFLVCCLGWS